MNKITKTQKTQRLTLFIGITALLTAAFSFFSLNAYLVEVLYLAWGTAGVKMLGGSVSGLLNFKKPKQYLYILPVAAAAYLVCHGGAALLEMSLKNGFGLRFGLDFTPETLRRCLLFLLVGFAEELIFRVVIQDALVGVFKHKPAAVAAAALIFGLWHFGGGIYQIIFAFFGGIIFGFSKYLFKNCTYISLALAHFLYDLSISVFRLEFLYYS